VRSVTVALFLSLSFSLLIGALFENFSLFFEHALYTRQAGVNPIEPGPLPQELFLYTNDFITTIVL
jgi:hypothetical protein